MQTQQLSPLARTVAESVTDIWNDSCALRAHASHPSWARTMSSSTS